MKNLLVLLMFCLLISSCKKEDPPKHPLASAELRQAINMKEGSYFVYKNTLTGVTDSFWVSRYNNDFKTHSGIAYEIIECEMKDAFDNFIAFSYSFAFKYHGSEAMIVFMNKDYNFIPVLMMPFNEHTESVSTDSDSSKTGLQMRKMYSSFTVNGQSYPDVYEVYAFNTELVNNIQDTVLLMHSFISLNAGMVKFTYRKKGSQSLIAQDSWELERSKIIR